MRRLTKSLTKMLAAFAAGFLVAVTVRPAHAQAEYDVKAAFLFNFAKYIEWPSSALSGNGSFVIGIVGRDPFGRSIDDLVQGKSIGTHSVVVRRYKWTDDISACHMLFVPSGEADLSRIAKLHGKPVVVVGESPGFAKKGGTINFILDQGRVRFEINVQAAKESGVSISSKLLSLAKGGR